MPTATGAPPSEEVIVPKKKDKSKKKDKDRSEKKSSKKRQREEDRKTDGQDVGREGSPSKRARTSSPTDQLNGSTHKSTTKEWLSPAADLNNDRTPLHEQTTSFYVPISPISLRHPLKGLCAEHLSPLILTYYPPLNGIVLSYRDAKLSSQAPTSSASQPGREQAGPAALAQQIDEYAPSFIWLTATFLVLRPEKGIWLDAVVNLQNESHLGLIVWNLFSASISRERLPKDWHWTDVTPGVAAKRTEEENGWDVSDEHGYFLDGEGKRLPRQISVRVKDFEASPATEGDRGFVSLEATLLSVEEEEELEKEEAAKAEELRDKKKAERRRELQMAGAFSNAQSAQTATDGGGGHADSRKHRSSY